VLESVDDSYACTLLFLQATNRIASSNNESCRQRPMSAPAARSNGDQEGSQREGAKSGHKSVINPLARLHQNCSETSLSGILCQGKIYLLSKVANFNRWYDYPSFNLCSVPMPLFLPLV